MLLEPGPPVLEESESLELEVSGPLLLASMSKGSESLDSDSEESESSDSVPDDSDSDDSESSGPVPSGLTSPASAPEGLRSSSGSGERWPQDSKQSVLLSLSEDPGEDSAPPPGVSVGAESPSGSPAPPVSSPQSSLTRLGLFLQAWSAHQVAVRA